jgi:hypothetical protein
VFGKYHNNQRTSIQLYEQETGEPFMTASVNMPDEYLTEDMVCIKNYSENEGILDVLINAQIVLPLDLIQPGIMKCMLIVSKEHYKK